MYTPSLEMCMTQDRRRTPDIRRCDKEEHRTEEHRTEEQEQGCTGQKNT